MRNYMTVLISFFLFSFSTYGNNGLINVKSNHTVRSTAELFKKILKKKGMTIFNVIDHSTGAEKVGKKLRPTVLIVFGNPKVGTPLMQCNQSVAIDLPQKALIWKDEKGDVWFSYNDPEYLAKRHNIKGCTKILKKIENVLANFSKAATK